MFAAFGGAASAGAGYMGLILGAIFAGLVYVVIAIIVKIAGVNWIGKLMPAVVIGPTVSIIGLSLAGNAVGDALKYAAADGGYVMNTQGWIGFICALITLFTVIICHRKRNPFPFFIDTQNNELARLCFLCNQWSSNFHQGY